MNKKKLWILILSSLAVIVIAATIVLLVLFGGKGTETPIPTTPVADVPVEPYLELNESKITLDIHNDITLQCTVVGITDPVVWNSSDSAVATVENGKVIAKAVGETEIVATAGSLNAKCTVIVEDKGVVPAMQAYGHDLEIRRTHTYDVSPAILFAGMLKDVSDAELSYQVADNTVATIDENGIATALKEGTTTFTVSGSFRGIKMIPVTGTIVVKKNIVVAMNSLNVNIYACDPDGTYVTQFQMESAVYAEDVLQNDAELVWSSEDENIATVENGVITAHRAGITMINAAYTTPDGDVINAGVVVNVERPVIKLDELYEFDLSNKGGSSTMDLGELVPYVDGLFTGFFDITDEERQEIKGASYKGKLSLPNKNFTKHGFRRYALESELVSIQFDGLAITKKIYTIGDLSDIATSANTLDGYYRLEKNIDAGGRTVTLVGSWTNSSTKGFVGIFEGNGYTISNLSVGGSGLFNCIGAATIRNLGLANVSGSGKVLATEVHGATIENIAVSSKNCETVFGYVGARTKLANLVAILDNGKYVIQTYGSASDAENTVQNFLIVAGTPEDNGGWSGTRVPGVFYNYYQNDAPKDLYGLDVYKSKEEMLLDLKNNGVPASFDFGIRLDGSKLYYNDAVICRYEIDVTAPASVHRGTSCTVKALDSTFSLKKSVKGISINSTTGVVSVAKDVPEFTEFTVVIQHKEYTDVREEVTIRVTIDYKPVQTDVAVRYDLSTGAESYSFTIPEYADTFKRIGWMGTDGFSEGVTVENGVFTLTAEAVKALGSGDGTLCVYTEEENVFYVDAIIADKFIYTYNDLAALYNAKTITGYYMLANDIHAGNTSALTLIGTWTNKSSEGFIGTFNGDGHIIYDLKVGSAGLFGYVGTGTIKNLALVNVYGGTNALANEAHGMRMENVFISSPDAARVINFAGSSSTENVVAILEKGQQYIVTNGSASDHNSHKNIISVVSDPKTNNGWSGTMVVGFFQNYYSFDNPVAKYNLKHYYTAADLLVALEKDNVLASWTDSSFTYENGAVLFNGQMIVLPEIVVDGPSYAYRGQTTKLDSPNAVFALKEAIEGITVAADGTITVDASVADQTAFTVIATHSVYAQFVKEIPMIVAIDYNEIDLTDTVVEFDRSTNASRYRCTIPGYEGTFKAIGWKGEGYIDANGISVRNGQLTITRVAMASIHSGSGTLCVYTEEENAYLLNVIVADKIIKTVDDLKAIATTSNTLDGYYVLGADIYCNGENFKLVGGWSSSVDSGFIGTFDGRGYIIDGYNGGTSGLFYCTGSNAVIRNVAFTNATGTNVIAGTEVHGTTFENIFVGGNAQYFNEASWDSPTYKNVVFASSNTSANLFKQGNSGTLNLSNVAVMGSKLYSYWGASVNKNNANIYADSQSLISAFAASGELDKWMGSFFGVKNSCLTFNGKTVVVPFTISCDANAPRGGSIIAKAPNASFALKEPVDGVSVNASTGVITIESSVKEGTTFTITAASSAFPGYVAEKTITVVINWQDVDWTVYGSLADIAKGESSVSVTLPETPNGNISEIFYGTDNSIREGYTYADGVLTLSGSTIDTIYNATGCGEQTLYLCTDTEHRYAVTVTMITKIIKTQSDLQSIATTGALDGYYILANDIVCDGTTEIKLSCYTTTSTSGFIGTFDGRGYSISNVKVGKLGFFGGIGSGTVKNIAFIDVVSTENYALAQEIHGSTFENVFVSTNARSMVDSCWDSPVFKNVIFVSALENGRLFTQGSTGVLKLNNVFVVGSSLYGYWGATADNTNAAFYTDAEALLTAIGAADELNKWAGSSFSIADGKLLFNGKVVLQ